MRGNGNAMNRTQKIGIAEDTHGNEAQWNCIEKPSNGNGKQKGG